MKLKDFSRSRASEVEEQEERILKWLREAMWYMYQKDVRGYTGLWTIVNVHVNDVKILTSCSSTSELLVRQSILISKLKPSFNANLSSVPLSFFFPLLYFHLSTTCNIIPFYIYLFIVNCHFISLWWCGMTGRNVS